MVFKNERERCYVDGDSSFWGRRLMLVRGTSVGGLVVE